MKIIWNPFVTRTFAHTRISHDIWHKCSVGSRNITWDLWSTNFRWSCRRDTVLRKPSTSHSFSLLFLASMIVLCKYFVIKLYFSSIGGFFCRLELYHLISLQVDSVMIVFSVLLLKTLFPIVHTCDWLVSPHLYRLL